MARQPITRANPYTPTRGAFAGRTFTTERQYRDALAQRKGYASLAEQQRQPKVIRSERGLRGLSPREQEERGRALRVVRLMRKKGKSLTDAARQVETTPNTVRKYVGDTVEKQGNRYVAMPRDTLARTVNMIAVEFPEPVPITTTSSRITTLIAEHADAVKKYVIKGDASDLKKFEGKYVQVGSHRYYFLTDTGEIDFRSRFGLLSFESLYAGTV